MFDYIIRNALIMDGSGEPAYRGRRRDHKRQDRGSGRRGRRGGTRHRRHRPGPGSRLHRYALAHRRRAVRRSAAPRARSPKASRWRSAATAGFRPRQCLDEPGRAELESWRKRHGIEEDWCTMGEFLSAFEKRRIGINVAHAGRATATCGRPWSGLRTARRRRDEIARMQAVGGGIDARRARSAYPRALSTPPGASPIRPSLSRSPKAFSPTAASTPATSADERAQLIEEAVDEAITVGRGAGVPVQIAHHKACGSSNWGKVKGTLEMIREARGEGIDVTADQYPYTASATSLSILLPHWAHDGGDKALLERIKTRSATSCWPTSKDPATAGSSAATATGRACSSAASAPTRTEAARARRFDRSPSSAVAPRRDRARPARRGGNRRVDGAVRHVRGGYRDGHAEREHDGRQRRLRARDHRRARLRQAASEGVRHVHACAGPLRPREARDSAGDRDPQDDLDGREEARD